jgi:PAS domain S-box-containing protein
LIAFVGLSVLPVLFVGIYGIYVNIKATERIALENVEHDVQATWGRASNFLANIEGDLRVVVNSTEAQEYVRSIERGNSSTSEQKRLRLAEELRAFARTKGIYYQIRVINEDREEVLRIESSDILDSATHFSSVPSEKLRTTGQTYYFLLTAELHRGETVLSPVELIYKETQRLPVLSFATPLYGPTKRVGLLVANVFAGHLFDLLEAQRNRGMDEKVVLVSSDGHYLYDSDERKDWNKLIASREEDNLQKDYPASISRTILSGKEGIISGESGEFLAYAPLLPLGRHVSRGVDGARFTPSLYLLESVPRASITRGARGSAVAFVAIVMVFFCGALGLGLLATREFTRPLSELRRGAEIIARGNYHHRLHVETGDEIEVLARRFNDMAISLEAHEREIQDHRAHLEEMVDHRTREMVEEKRKLQAVLDNIPSAFVMLDRDGCVKTASATFTSITGLNLRSVIGKRIRDVLQDNGLCRTAGAGAAWTVGSHIDRTVDRNGVEQILEHASIPITEGGEVTSILQIITNITKRKRLEEHLIHSQKLMATGEMAAIIAHGFRNSLTSIKMILQLQQESRDLQRRTKRSLGVALDSIGRMEAVVQDLLNFARPSPMLYGTADLNHLMDQAITLLGPRLKEARIAVRKSLDARVPPMTLDSAQVREAIVNLLLNALQAMENSSARATRGTIRVTTKRMVLTKTLREYSSPEVAEESVGESQASGREIVLRKGRECVLVAIADNGPGIDRAVIRRILDPFFTTKTNGTGLGLPMVKRSVNAHGGVLSVRSTKGKGATFEMVLPVRFDAREHSGEEVSNAEG